jgi:beta-phosphoglucomutase-like phosphatase (HAD superfamily)
MSRPSRHVITRDQYDAVLLDLDGVITDTASLHAACWQQVFDEYLQERAKRRGEKFRPFDPITDYQLYVDGKPRFDGVRAFLTSRSVQLPEGSPDEPPRAETVGGLGNRKNELINNVIEDIGIKPYVGSVKLIHQLRDRGFKIAVVTSSQNCTAVFKGCQAGRLLRGESRWRHDPHTTTGRETRAGYLFDGCKVAGG